jgi:TolA-binding protein
MNKLFLLPMLFFLLTAGCSGSGPNELYKTAQFEEKQNNTEHAAKLYNEIIKKYPDSEEARKARENLKKIPAGPKTP